MSNTRDYHVILGQATHRHACVVGWGLYMLYLNDCFLVVTQKLTQVRQQSYADIIKQWNINREVSKCPDTEVCFLAQTCHIDVAIYSFYGVVEIKSHR